MSINAQTVTAGQALKVLKKGWEMQQNAGIKISYMLHGRPGIGKTQLMEELARHVGGKLYDLRLTTIEPSDLRGMPHYDHENKLTVWYRPSDLPRTEEPAVLFLDELSSASPFLQPTVYGLLQERRIGEHKIPDNTIIVAAGNTVDDGAVAYEMGTAIANRLIHMVVEADAKDWIKGFAIPQNLHPAVTAFIETMPQYFETTKEALTDGNVIAATPRSWERVSNIMYNVTAPEDRILRDIMIAGTVGKHIAAEFAIIADDISATVKVTEMVKKKRADRVAMYPNTMHGLNAMVFGLLGMADEANVNEVIEIMADLRDLKTLRTGEEEFRRMPLKEMSTHGFENLLGKLMEKNLHSAILQNQAWQDYQQEMEEAGLM